MTRKVKIVPQISNADKNGDEKQYVTAKIIRQFIDMKTNMVVYCTDEIKGTLAEVGKMLVYTGDIDPRLI